MASPDWNRYARALPSIAAAVGRTPAVRLNRVTAGVTPAIYVKVEWYGTTGSLEDRIYLHMFERAEARRALKHVDIPEREHPLDPYTVDQLDRYQKTWEIIG